MTDILRELSWVDLVILVVLLAGVFIGWTGGFLRYALNVVGVVAAFVAASLLKGPISDTLSGWTAFNPPLRELLVFIFLFVVLTIAAWFAVRALFGRAQLPMVRQLDELGGAVLGLVFVVVFVVLLLVTMDTFFRDPSVQAADQEQAGVLIGFYDTMNDSLLVSLLRETAIPVVGYVARPFVPQDVALFLHVR